MIFFVNPHLITEAGDPHTGIPIMPVMMVYAYTVAKNKGIEVAGVDCVGEDPLYMRLGSCGFTAQGLDERHILKRVPKEPRLIALYSRSIASFISIEVLIKEFQRNFPKSKIAILENTQAVTSHNLAYTKDLLFKAGADYVLEGDPDAQIDKLYYAVLGQMDWRRVPGLWSKNEPYRQPEKNVGMADLDELPIPDWEAVRYQGYWELRYAHGPAPKPFMSVVTSRGCPFSCAFCSVPSLNNRKWRAHSAEYVADLMTHHQKKYGVDAFQWEDLNPTSSEKRIIRVTELIRERGLKFNWATVSGTKIETLSENTVKAMVASGCNYLSFSPESGSKEHLRKRMNKPFDHDHALRLAGEISRLNVPVQACFVIGYPGETDSDFNDTADYIKKLSRAGVNEILVMMATPIPGTKLAKDHPEAADERKAHEYTMAARHQKNFSKLIRQRNYLYLTFFLQKLLNDPRYFITFFIKVITRDFETKAQQAVYRILWWNFIKIKSRIRGRKLPPLWESIING